MIPFSFIGGTIVEKAFAGVASVLRRKVSLSTVLLALALIYAGMYMWRQHALDKANKEYTGWQKDLGNSTKAREAALNAEHAKEVYRCRHYQDQAGHRAGAR
jgi:hypothetical protein